MVAYDRITDRIISLLEQGTIPWQKPWKAQTTWPRNFVTRKPYRGVNVFLLISMSYESPFWLTYRQAQQLGGTIRKGEHACPVVFWKPLKVKDEKSEEERKIPLLRIYHVFNSSQCDGLKPLTEADDKPLAFQRPMDIVSKMPNAPVIKHGMTQAFYSPTEDIVAMPARERFDSEDGYFATLFHELIHSTGHKSRLDRATLTGNTGFGSDPYSKEELVAELGSAYLCGYAEIVDRTINQSVAYLNNWLARLKSDRTLIVQAAAQAQRAVDYIIGATPVETDATE